MLSEVRVLAGSACARYRGEAAATGAGPLRRARVSSAVRDVLLRAACGAAPTTSEDDTSAAASALTRGRGMIDAVLSHHLNPLTCGIAKFNRRLARELGVACFHLRVGQLIQHPLVSISPLECPLDSLPDYGAGRFELFLHAWTDAALDVLWLRRAQPAKVYAADAVIADQLRAVRPDVIIAWCPSTIEGNAHRGAINVLTFGMAHKIQMACHVKLKTLLDATGQDYTVSLSTAVHEGNPWASVGDARDSLWGIYRDRLRYLGYLADDAIAKELCTCTAVALFFDPAVRANNTTFWTAALDTVAGTPIISNFDAHSPTWSKGRTQGGAENLGPFYDIAALRQFPQSGQYTEGCVAVGQYGWPALKGLLTTHVLQTQ